MSRQKNALKITEIFYSIQGESDTFGWPTVFIRLTGCPLRCQYCDTAYAFHGGERMSLDAIIAKVQSFNAKYVCVTGGEPLAQPDCTALLSQLCDLGYFVSIETSGALPISAIDDRVRIVLDIKTPDSLEVEKNHLENLSHIKAQDMVKIVICSRSDYEWAKQFVVQYDLLSKTMVLFSPVWETLNPTELADWILSDNLQVRFQLQLHKVLWNDEPGR